MSHRDHLYSNWKKIHTLPVGPKRTAEMRNLRLLSRGNMIWVVRRLIGGVPSDNKAWIDKSIADGTMIPPSPLTRQRRYEANKRKNQ